MSSHCVRRGCIENWFRDVVPSTFSKCSMLIISLSKRMLFVFTVLKLLCECLCLTVFKCLFLRLS